MLYGKEHVERYQATDGAEGHVWLEDSHTLLLTTTGHKSGKRRTTPLIYGRSGDDVLLVASDGGAAEPPAWFKNLEADPEVGVQILGDKFKARARTATAEEKPAMWAEMLSQWQYYDRYQEMTEREIPVIVLERTG